MSTESLDKRAERVNYILKNGGELRTELVIGLIDDLRAALASPQAQPEQEISASEALYAFAAWLTCADGSITFGSRHVATQAADLVQAFSHSQGLAEPRENWSDLLKPYPGAPAAQPEQAPLSFAEFRAANVARCLKWHPQGIDSWSPSDWMTAVTGELGELASLLKMRNRERDGLPGNKFSPSQKQIADELADVLTYLDLLAEVLGVDLGKAAVSKFNEISERVGFPDRLTERG